MTDRSIHIWGDSVTKGIIFDEARSRYAILRENCMTLLAERLGRPVENHSRMGSTAPQALELMAEEPLPQGCLALFALGGNDCDFDWPAVAAAPEEEHQPKTEMALFRRSLERMVAQARAVDAQPVLAVPPPLQAQRFFAWVTRGIDADAVMAFMGGVDRVYRWQESYAFAVLEAAANLGVPVLNLREAFLCTKHYENMLCVDGIHPNAAGHQLMLEAAWEYFG